MPALSASDVWSGANPLPVAVNTWDVLPNTPDAKPKGDVFSLNPGTVAELAGVPGRLADNFVPLNYNVSRRPLRQNFNGLLMENGAFYISYIKNIKKTKCRLSGNIGIYEMPEYSSVEIDEKLDWFIAEHIFKSQFKFNKKLLKLFFQILTVL